MKKLLAVVVVLGCLLMLARLVGPSILDRSQNHTLQPGPYRVSPEAEALHKTLLVADLHADSLLWGRDLLAASKAGHVDLPRLMLGNVGIQAFTVFSTIPRGINIERNEDTTDLVPYIGMLQGWPLKAIGSPKGVALYQAARLQKFVDKSKGEMVLLRTRGDLAKFLQKRQAGSHAVAALLGTEGAQPLEGKIENLDALYDAGFRMMSPAHFTDTAVGGSAAGAVKGGLTPLGREWVKQMEARGMLIDVAHASADTLRDVTAMATKPVIVSHTGVKGVCNNNRNLSDEQLRAVAATGGVIGVGFWDVAACGTDAAAIARAIRYTAGVVGVEHVALGSDFDGAVTEPFDSSGLALITEALMQQGVSQHDIRLIMGENVARVLSQVLPE
ncbi:MAG TPA: membrane dipeptidase [Candidatus Bathyarchaeia archaeon]|nr:membrane dipeptidase [Candidatus Bathyarchaeia archaeon]